jgi:hypothetical protein
VNDRSTVVFTAIYPEVLPFVTEWHRSLRDQEDKEFEVVIALHGVSRQALFDAIGSDIEATFVSIGAEETGATVRDTGLRCAIDVGDTIVLVDADDVLRPPRTRIAKELVKDSDLAGCALELIDTSGSILGYRYPPPRETPLGELLFRTNLLGLSNSTYRASLLRQLLPIPAECVLVDWFLSTRARELGARMVFDPSVGMLYRQHANNIARVLPPFSIESVSRAANLVAAHHELLLKTDFLTIASRARVRHETARVAMFTQAIENPSVASAYIAQLNTMPGPHLWWEFVAHPMLENVWNH